MTAPRLFAIVPAAGRSRRMGRPKLLLPLGGRTVLACVLKVLRPFVEATLVVCRADDESLAGEARGAGAIVVQPEIPPPEMRQSVEHGLRALAARFAPSAADGWLLIPADHPVLDRTVVESVIAAWREQPDRIVVPVHGSRRGHPTLFPWSLCEDVFALSPEAGLNQLVRSRGAEVVEAPVESASALLDLDTPEDYEVVQRMFS